MEDEIESAPAKFAYEEASVIENHEAVLNAGDRVGRSVGNGSRVVMDDGDFVQESGRRRILHLIETAVKFLQIGRFDLPGGHHLGEGVGVDEENGKSEIGVIEEEVHD
jgi:hypothetical protein